MTSSGSEEFESADEENISTENPNEGKSTHHQKKNIKPFLDCEENLTNNESQNRFSEGNVQKEKNNESKENKFNVQEEIKHEIIKNTKDADDGWDDFGDEEDWIDTKTTIPKETNLKDEKFVDVVSSYSTFPVLNKLSPLKNEVKIVDDKKIPICDEKNVNENINIPNEKGLSWSGWKPWGGVVSSVLSAATDGVNSITSHVSHVIESSIGAPDPEELVKMNRKLEGSDGEIHDVKSNDTGMPSFGNLVSGVTSIGNKVISGGLDTLEGIGKKTMNMLQENDPLLLNKRKMMGLESERPILSQVLREAKNKSEEVEKNLKQIQKQSYKKQLHFESLFDHYYGLVHLEALEMLSKQSSLKLQSLLDPLSGKALAELNETLNEVNELCDLGDIELEDTEESLTYCKLEEKLKTAIEDLGIEINFEEILKSWKKYEDQLNDDSNKEPIIIYEWGLRCLAEICALQMNKMHKIAELLIIKEHHSTANEADSLVLMTTIFCQHLHWIANKFGGKLNTFEQNEELSSLITNMFLEVYNSTSYVQSAFKLFIPILQIGAA